MIYKHGQILLDTAQMTVLKTGAAGMPCLFISHTREHVIAAVIMPQTGLELRYLTAQDREFYARLYGLPQIIAPLVRQGA